MKNMEIRIRKIKSDDIDWIKNVFNQRWGGDFIITRGKIHKPEALDGFVAEADGEKFGLITFKITGKEMELVSLDSFLEKKGIGTTLVNEVINLAKGQKLERVWGITTNDNLNALKFWQNRGLYLTKIYPNALEASRKLKPGIPLIGENGIPLKDEIELEIRLKNFLK